MAGFDEVEAEEMGRAWPLLRLFSRALRTKWVSNPVGISRGATWGSERRGVRVRRVDGLDINKITIYTI